MKKIYLLMGSLSSTAMLFAQADPNVSKVAQKPNVVIEEFTGIHCGFCPDGHRIAQEIVAANPGKAFTIANHTGGFAKPQVAEDEDFRIKQAAMHDRLAFKGTNTSSYPSAMFNRHKFASRPILNVVARATFPKYADTIMKFSGNAPVNVGITAVVYYPSRTLKVRVQVYYTGNSTSAENRLHLMLTESNIKTLQSNYGNYNPTMITSDGKYLQQHVLREALTGQDGIVISGANTAAGTMKYDQTLEFTIPEKYAVNTTTFTNTPVDLHELEVIAIVTSSAVSVSNNSSAYYFTWPATNVYSEILNVNGTHAEYKVGIDENAATASTVEVYPNPASDDVITINNESRDAVVEIYNVAGVKVYSEIPKATNAKVNIAELTPGMYFLRVNDNGVIKSAKLIKE